MLRNFLKQIIYIYLICIKYIVALSGNVEFCSILIMKTKYISLFVKYKDINVYLRKLDP